MEINGRRLVGGIFDELVGWGQSLFGNVFSSLGKESFADTVAEVFKITFSGTTMCNNPTFKGFHLTHGLTDSNIIC